MKFIETSAKTAFNVGTSFISMTSDIIKQLQTREIKVIPDGNKIEINNNKVKDLSKKDCCK